MAAQQAQQLPVTNHSAAAPCHLVRESGQGSSHSTTYSENWENWLDTRLRLLCVVGTMPVVCEGRVAGQTKKLKENAEQKWRREGGGQVGCDVDAGGTMACDGWFMRKGGHCGIHSKAIPSLWGMVGFGDKSLMLRQGRSLPPAHSFSALLDNAAAAAVEAGHARHHPVLLRLVQQHAARGRRIQVLRQEIVERVGGGW